MQLIITFYDLEKVVSTPSEIQNLYNRSYPNSLDRLDGIDKIKSALDFGIISLFAPKTGKRLKNICYAFTKKIPVKDFLSTILENTKFKL